MARTVPGRRELRSETSRATVRSMPLKAKKEQPCLPWPAGWLHVRSVRLATGHGAAILARYLRDRKDAIMATSASQLSAPEYDVILAPNVRAPLHDGVKLATDIYLPARGCDRVPGRLRRQWFR